MVPGIPVPGGPTRTCCPPVGHEGDGLSLPWLCYEIVNSILLVVLLWSLFLPFLTWKKQATLNQQLDGEQFGRQTAWVQVLCLHLTCPMSRDAGAPQSSLWMRPQPWLAP